MSFVDYNSKIIHCKIIYYGPSLSGKTTNLRWIYQQMVNDRKANPVNSEVEIPPFCELVSLSFGKFHGFEIVFNLYSIPREAAADATRKVVLRAVDGLIFVADSQIERMKENIEFLNNLEINLEQLGYDIRKLPLVIQYNKRDLPNAAPLAELRKSLNRYNVPEFEACAAEGKGVDESLQIISVALLNELKGSSKA
jgi:signal recognition particle receptor subunit beta